jgi:GINS complex subunit 2
MSLPQSLRTSVTPPELELIASEQLVEIIPLVSMERTAFISVNYQFHHFVPSILKQ